MYLPSFLTNNSTFPHITLKVLFYSLKVLYLPFIAITDKSSVGLISIPLWAICLNAVSLFGVLWYYY